MQEEAGLEQKHAEVNGGGSGEEIHVKEGTKDTKFGKIEPNRSVPGEEIRSEPDTKVKLETLPAGGLSPSQTTPTLATETSSPGATPDRKCIVASNDVNKPDSTAGIGPPIVPSTVHVETVVGGTRVVTIPPVNVGDGVKKGRFKVLSGTNLIPPANTTASPLQVPSPQGPPMQQPTPEKEKPIEVPKESANLLDGAKAVTVSPREGLDQASQVPPAPNPVLISTSAVASTPPTTGTAATGQPVGSRKGRFLIISADVGDATSIAREVRERQASFGQPTNAQSSTPAPTVQHDDDQIRVAAQNVAAQQEVGETGQPVLPLPSVVMNPVVATIPPSGTTMVVPSATHGPTTQVTGTPQQQVTVVSTGNTVASPVSSVALGPNTVSPVASIVPVGKHARTVSSPTLESSGHFPAKVNGVSHNLGGTDPHIGSNLSRSSSTDTMSTANEVGSRPPLPKPNSKAVKPAVVRPHTKAPLSFDSKGIASPMGLGKVFYFLEQMKHEVSDADKAMKSLQVDNKLLKDKNKELEARCRELERRLSEEKCKVKNLKRKLNDAKAASNTTESVNGINSVPHSRSNSADNIETPEGSRKDMTKQALSVDSKQASAADEKQGPDGAAAPRVKNEALSTPSLTSSSPHRSHEVLDGSSEFRKETTRENVDTLQHPVMNHPNGQSPGLASNVGTTRGGKFSSTESFDPLITKEATLEGVMAANNASQTNGNPVVMNGSHHGVGIQVPVMQQNGSVPIVAHSPQISQQHLRKGSFMNPNTMAATMNAMPVMNGMNGIPANGNGSMMGNSPSQPVQAIMGIPQSQSFGNMSQISTGGGSLIWTQTQTQTSAFPQQSQQPNISTSMGVNQQAQQQMISTSVGVHMLHQSPPNTIGHNFTQTPFVQQGVTHATPQMYQLDVFSNMGPPQNGQQQPQPPQKSQQQSSQQQGWSG